mgnify:CR=1 FL=1
MLIRSSVGIAFVVSSLLLTGCASSDEGAGEPTQPQVEVPPERESEPAQETDPETETEPETEPKPEPPPVELAATLSLEAGEWVLAGETNLPDGALLDFNVTHWGSGCLDDACTEFESWSQEEYDEFYRQAIGSVMVSEGKFSEVFEGSGELPGICNTNTQAVDDWTTDIAVTFAVDAGAAENSDLISAQPAEVYELFGYSGERLKVAPSLERIEISDGFAALAEGECAVP